MTKMALQGQKGSELVKRAFWSLGFFRDKLKGALYLVELVEKELRLKKKERRKKKEKKEKQRGFVSKERFVVLPPFPFIFFLELSSVVS